MNRKYRFCVLWKSSESDLLPLPKKFKSTTPGHKLILTNSSLSIEPGWTLIPLPFEKINIRYKEIKAIATGTAGFRIPFLLIRFIKHSKENTVVLFALKNIFYIIFASKDKFLQEKDVYRIFSYLKKKTKAKSIHMKKNIANFQVLEIFKNS